MKVTRKYMTDKLLSWNPHWNPQTVKGWKLDQLTQIYRKESAKTVAMIRASLGLPN